MQDKVNLRIDWASHQAAEYACKNFHYSKSIPVPPIVKVGAWENDKYIGCVLFSRGASSNLLKPYGLNQDQGCELTRVALTSHKTPVSRIMMLAIKFLKKKCPELKLIVSFADPQCGHHGGIYQATNWLYVGDTAKGKEYWHKGKRLHSRQVSEKGWNDFINMKPFDRQIIDKLIDNEVKTMDELKEVRFELKVRLADKSQLRSMIKEYEYEEDYEKCARILKKLKDM